MTYGGNFSNSTPLDDEPRDIDAALDLRDLEAALETYEDTVEVESDVHTVRRHTEFYPLHPDMRDWSIAEVDAALGLSDREQAAIEQRAQEAAYGTLGRRVL